MDYQINNNIITINIIGEINSTNAFDIEKDINDTLENNTFNKIILNFDKLSYISSSGLRIILKLKQKYHDVTIVNCSSEVYDILSMTGFVNIINVKKCLKEVSVDGCDVIGTGFFSTVYRLDKEMIIKVFNRTSDERQIERELKLSKEAFIKGIPTAISYDIVKVGEKLGVRFEMLDCMSLKDAFLKHQDKYDYYIDKYVNLLKTINTTTCSDLEILDMKDAFIKKVEVLKEYLDNKHYKKLSKLINSIPSVNTFIHGDCHFKNIMVQGDEFLLIDMDTLSRGHFIFELATLRAPYVAFEEDDKGNCERFLGVSGDLCDKIYNDILDKYFNEIKETQKEKIALVCYLHMVWWNRVNEPTNMVRLNGCLSRLIKLIDKYDDLEV